MFSSSKVPSDVSSHLPATASVSSETLECLIICDLQNQKKIMQQLEGYSRSIQKKIMMEHLERGKTPSHALTPENFPDYFYSLSIRKKSSFLQQNPKYEIKITGTYNALKSAVEALVFANFYDKKSCVLPNNFLVEYAESLSRGEIPESLMQIEFNF